MSGDWQQEGGASQLIRALRGFTPNVGCAACQCGARFVPTTAPDSRHDERRLQPWAGTVPEPDQKPYV
eukprot:357123-Chlamydomonas_euryale.AAC.1